MKKILLIGIPLLALLFAGCSALHITDSISKQGITYCTSK
jgi:hypothetical protein